MDHNINLPIPLTAGSLESYIQTVNRFPLLTQEEEFGLAVRLNEHNDLDSARLLILSHLRVVISVARSYAGYGLPQADLIQEGNIGLMKAVKRFNPQHGVRLVSFALHWIRAEIHEYILRNWRLVKIATTKAQRKLFFNLRSMTRKLGPLKHQDASIIGDQLNVSTNEVFEMEARFNGQEVTLEPAANEEDESSVAPISYLAAPANTEPSRVLEQKQIEIQQISGLTRALASLDDRSRRIIEARWLREGESTKLHDLANEFGVSAERIRQIEQKAMTKMQLAILAQK